MLNLGRAILTLPRRSFVTSPVVLKGHSKWQNIKATKGKNDLMKSQKMNMLLRKVKTAVRQDGFDIKLNRKLADLQLEFKSAGLSLDTLNNYLVRLKSKPEQTFHFDLIGPSGSFFIIEAEGDNKNKLQSSIAKTLKKIGAFRFATDSLRNRFEEKGVVRILPKDPSGKTLRVEDVEELAIELDCEEVTKVEEEDGDRLEFTTDASNLSKVETALTEKGFSVESAETELIAIHPVTLSEVESGVVEKFYEQLQEIEEVKQIYDNLSTSEAQPASATA
ncbi:hypothetical protein FO519_003159 [Halicephalobus sp. NKZ332]|nr:hypothetical protein FO519_003159 [Halicephalobus sp. NKZ332]